MASLIKAAPVLVVDDDPDMREALRDTLEDQGFAVAEAADGSEALKYLESHPLPPVVLLDWNMAPMNAPEFMAVFTREPRFRGVPVVLVTADARVEDKAKRAGYAACLQKPVNLDTLFSVVGKFVEAAEGEA